MDSDMREDQKQRKKGEKEPGEAVRNTLETE